MYVFFAIYNIVVAIINSHPISFGGLSWVYIYSLPVYIFIGIPCSFIIERINIGYQWINYVLIGFLIGMILNGFSILNGEIDPLEWDIVWWYGIAAFAYYASLNILKWIDNKLRSNDSI